MNFDSVSPQRGPDLPDVVALMRPHCGPMKVAEGLQALEEGYAWPVDRDGPLLFFSGVDSHVDGVGWRVLVLVSGEGVFEHGAERIPLREGQSILFDDRLEHGFEVEHSLVECYAVTVPVGPTCVPWDRALEALRAALTPYDVTSIPSIELASLEDETQTSNRRRRRRP